MKHVIILVLAIYATFHLMVFNDYMHYKTVRAEIVSREMVSGLDNKPKLTITYEREDGHIFKLPANAAEWQSAVPGEQHWVRARPFDVQPNHVDTILHTIAPLIVMFFTMMYVCWFILCFSWSKPQETEIVQPSPKGPLEKRS